MKKLNGVKTQFSRKYSDVEISKSPGFRAFYVTAIKNNYRFYLSKFICSIDKSFLYLHKKFKYKNRKLCL